MSPYIIAADIGGSHISSTTLHIKNWQIDPQKIIETKTNSFGEKTAIIKSWVSNLQQNLQPEKPNLLHQIAIALPGPFDYQKGIFQAHPEGKMNSLEGENFKELLLPYFGEDLKISFENDAACFGLGTACFGAGKGYQRIIGITLGTGIGSSFIANQKIIKVHPSIPFGGELYAAPFRKSIGDDHFSTRWFVRQAAKDLDLNLSGVRALIEKAPEAYVESIFKIFAHNLHQFLSPYAKAFGAEIIIIGGNIAKAWPYFGKELDQLFQQNAIAVKPSFLNEQAIMLGAAKVFVDTYNEGQF